VHYDVDHQCNDILLGHKGQREEGLEHTHELHLLWVEDLLKNYITPNNILQYQSRKPEKLTVLTGFPASDIILLYSNKGDIL
jgi:hypothetical protein